MKKLFGARFYPIGSTDTEDPRGLPWSRTAAQGGKFFPNDNGANPDRLPRRGPFDDSAPGVVDEHIRESHRGGIDYFSTCFFYSAARKKSVQGAAIEAMAASTVKNAKYHIAFDSHTPSDLPVTSIADLRNIVDIWDDHFQSENYVRIDTGPGISVPRPVVDIVKLDDFAQVVCPAVGMSHRAVLDFIRNRTQEDIYFSASGLALPHWLKEASNAGYSAYTSYNRFTTWSNRDGGPPSNAPIQGPSPTTFAQLAANYRTEWEYLLGDGKKLQGVLKSYGLEYILDCTAGFDDRPWFPANKPVGIATPAELAAHMAEAFAFADMSPLVRLICIYAWNEYYEGGFIAPCDFLGRQKLTAVRKARNQ